MIAYTLVILATLNNSLVSTVVPGFTDLTACRNAGSNYRLEMQHSANSIRVVDTSCIKLNDGVIE